ncbi:hypothetical protein BC936DRAFT_137273 [Jimgerdemannia flammicorona]|uniref:MAPEG family-domain-containing protein n=1 Tax=Jimgerdemannia flammicorona TaxID=994334 RepID=A0A433DJB5_9FUNG|nr:hypothetical protein BC936DRAFT_137273 [Jimgerdemannia flammicorona]
MPPLDLRRQLRQLGLPFPTTAIPAPLLVPGVPLLYLLGTYFARKIQSTGILDGVLVPWFARAGVKKENVPFATLGVVWTLTYCHPRIHRQELRGLSARLLASHENLMEQFPGFASAMIIAHIAKVPLDKQIGFGLLHMISRMAFYPAYIFNVDIARTSSFYIGLGCLPWLFGLSVLPEIVA